MAKDKQDNVETTNPVEYPKDARRSGGYVGRGDLGGRPEPEAPLEAAAEGPAIMPQPDDIREPSARGEPVTPPENVTPPGDAKTEG